MWRSGPPKGSSRAIITWEPEEHAPSGGDAKCQFERNERNIFLVRPSSTFYTISVVILRAHYYELTIQQMQRSVKTLKKKHKN